MIKNQTGQIVGADMFNLSDGSPFTGAASVFVEIGGGAQAAGAGTVSHKGNGSHEYLPTQAETNADYVAFIFTGTGAKNVKVQVYPVVQIDVDANGYVSADVKEINDATVNGNGTSGNKWRGA